MSDLDYVESAGGVRFRALKELYDRQSNADPNSLERRASEYALDLALSSKRDANQYLARNAFRNARHILARKDRSNRAEAKTPIKAFGTHSELREYNPAEHRDQHPYRLTEHSGDPSGNPYLQAAFRDLKQRLARRLRERHSCAPDVMEAMIQDVPVAETAEQLDYSERRIKDIRKMVRDETEALIEEVMNQ